jgi:hypothetical protein
VNDGLRKPVLLQHGLLDASSTWVMNFYPNQSLGFVLADDGINQLIKFKFIKIFVKN